MANEFLAVTDGTFTLSETKMKNQLYFYRNDNEVLNDCGGNLNDLLHVYLIQRMVEGQKDRMAVSNIQYEMSDDNKCIRVTAAGINEQRKGSENSNVVKKPNFFTKFLKKLFG